jgi:hypothetical protein
MKKRGFFQVCLATFLALLVFNQNEDWIFREYLVYKLFNGFTDTSFRVRLLTVNYIDSEKERKPIRQAAFLIKPVELFGAWTNFSIW